MVSVFTKTLERLAPVGEIVHLYRIVPGQIEQVDLGVFIDEETLEPVVMLGRRSRRGETIWQRSQVTGGTERDSAFAAAREANRFLSDHVDHGWRPGNATARYAFVVEEVREALRVASGGPEERREPRSPALGALEKLLF